MAIRRRTSFILAVALQVAVILGMIAYKTSILMMGTVVDLAIEPVDPRDLLRGDYVTFQYAISEPRRSLVTGGAVRNGETVYVVLERSGQLWNAVSVQRTVPAAGDVLFLRGKVAGGGLDSGVTADDWNRAPHARIRIVYGIEEYFIPEGTGAALDLGGRTVTPFARVSVDRKGRAVLKGIFIDDRRWPSPR
ncbi:MAG: GDYXXLXY domain-containing protein [bacterium]|nr:GDYXXLXY domain-containing protein [bacterium]